MEQVYEGDNFDLYWELAKSPKKTEIIEQITLENDTLDIKLPSSSAPYLQFLYLSGVFAYQSIIRDKLF